MAIVSMHSVLENNKNNTIDFYILYDENFNKNYLKYFDALNKYSNCNNIKLFQIKFLLDFLYTIVQNLPSISQI